MGDWPHSLRRAARVGRVQLRAANAWGCAGLAAVSSHHMDSAAGAAFRAVGCADVDTSISAWALIHRLASGSVSGRKVRSLWLSRATTRRLPHAARRRTRSFGHQSVMRAMADADNAAPCGKPTRELRPCERDAVSCVRTAALGALDPKRS